MMRTGFSSTAASGRASGSEWMGDQRKSALVMGTARTHSLPAVRRRAAMVAVRVRGKERTFRLLLLGGLHVAARAPARARPVSRRAELAGDARAHQKAMRPSAESDAKVVEAGSVPPVTICPARVGGAVGAAGGARAACLAVLAHRHALGQPHKVRHGL
jgi:hypothetical protein